MAMDLNAPLNNKQWVNALAIASKALDRGFLDDAEESFVQDMKNNFGALGTDYKPSVKQFNWLKSIAYENAGVV